MYKSDSGYIAIGKQTDANPVIPDIFVPLLEEDLSSDPNNERVKQIVGINWKSNLILQGLRKNGGKIKVMADPTTLGYFLDMAMNKSGTTGDATAGYTHIYDVEPSNLYTIEVKKGSYVHRLVSCQISKFGLMFENGHLVIEAEIVAKSKFNYGTLKTALTGAGMVAVVFGEEFDDEPCRGLVTGDTIQTWVNGVATDIVVATVASDKKSITCEATNVTAGIGSLITLKAQTPSYETLKRPFKFGQMLVGFGANETASTSNSATRALATALDELKLELDKGLEEKHFSGDNDPVILEGTPDMNFNVKKLLTTAGDVQQWNDIAKKACTIRIVGDEISAGVYCTLTIKLHNIKPKKVDNKTKVGEYIFDETDYFVEYDNTDGKAVAITLKNTVATI